MGHLAYIFLFFSLIFPSRITIADFHLMVTIGISCHAFSYLTFEYQLFSKRLWIQRAIVILFSVADFLIVSYLFGSLKPDKKHYIVYGISILALVLFLVFAYYINDKAQKKNLEAINKKLQDEKQE